MWLEVAYASSRQVLWKLCSGSPGLLPLCDKACMFLKELFPESWIPNEDVEQSLSHLPVNNWQEQEVTIHYCQPLRFGEYLLSQQSIAYLDKTNDWKALRDLLPTFFPSTSFITLSPFTVLCATHSDFMFLENSKPLPAWGSLHVLFILPGIWCFVCLFAAFYHLFYLLHMANAYSFFSSQECRLYLLKQQE